MKYNRLLFVLLMVIGMAGAVFAGETAGDLLNRAAAKYRSSKSISASFSVSGSNGASSGTIVVSGDKFAISSQGLSTWFDGKTQWTYSPSAKEVNVTEPTADELQQVNPFAVINTFSKQYSASFDGAPSGKLRRVKLTPKAPRADITQVIITIDTSTLYPTQIRLTDRQRHVTDIRVSNVKVGAALPLSSFRWDAAKHPGVEVVDLR